MINDVKADDNINDNDYCCNSTSDHGYCPVKFIDTIQDHKHIVLFYEDDEAAKKIEYNYIKNGLSKGQHCVYTIHKDADVDISFIENQMTDLAGIDVEAFKKRNLLHIYHISNPMHNKEGALKGAEDIMNTILAGLKPPLRVVSRLIPQIITEDQMLANIEVESAYHSDFHKFPGSLLCPYPVNKIQPISGLGQWIENILQNHHGVIFSTVLEHGIAFELE